MTMKPRLRKLKPKVRPLRMCHHCERKTQDGGEPSCYWCHQPWGSEPVKTAAAPDTDFKGTELEKDVIRAATEWSEWYCTDVDKPFREVAAQEAGLHNAVMALGSQEGGF